jgi:hypothetical protein
MNIRMMAALVLFALALGGCARSISNSGYVDPDYPYQSVGNPLYRGEIEELDLIVPANTGNMAAHDIGKSLSVNDPLNAELGAPLLVVQSGAIMPDEPMMRALGSRFRTAPFSGLPPRPSETAGAVPGSYGERLRLAAANGGYRQILVYWGMLETAQINGPTKIISWVPIVGSFVPDESQKMRIQLKAVLIDVASGRWRMFQPAPLEDSAISAEINRESSDQDQVALLKEAGYAGLADLVAQSGR